MIKLILIATALVYCIAAPIEENSTEKGKELLSNRPTPINPEIVGDPRPKDKITLITDLSEIAKYKREADKENSKAEIVIFAPTTEKTGTQNKNDVKVNHQDENKAIKKRELKKDQPKDVSTKENKKVLETTHGSLPQTEAILRQHQKREEKTPATSQHQKQKSGGSSEKSALSTADTHKSKDTPAQKTEATSQHPKQIRDTSSEKPALSTSNLQKTKDIPTQKTPAVTQHKDHKQHGTSEKPALSTADTHKSKDSTAQKTEATSQHPKQKRDTSSEKPALSTSNLQKTKDIPTQKTPAISHHKDNKRDTVVEKTPEENNPVPCQHQNQKRDSDSNIPTQGNVDLHRTKEIPEQNKLICQHQLEKRDSVPEKHEKTTQALKKTKDQKSPGKSDLRNSGHNESPKNPPPAVLAPVKLTSPQERPKRDTSNNTKNSETTTKTDDNPITKAHPVPVSALFQKSNQGEKKSKE